MTGIGACGFSSYRGTLTMAPNEAFYNGSNTCGACFEVTGPLGTEIFMAGDLCPVEGNEQWCSGDMTHFDLSSATFPNIAPASSGGSYTSIRPVVCPTSEKMSIITGHGNDDVTNDTFFPVYFFNHKVPIASVKAKDSQTGAIWQNLNRTAWNSWNFSPQAGGSAIVFPMNYQVTSVYGETIDFNIATRPTATGTKIVGTTQFSVWPSVDTNTCPTYEEFDIYVNKLNNADGRPVAQNWQVDTSSSTNLAYTGSLPSGATAAAQYNPFVAYGEWYWATRGAEIPASSLSAIEFWAQSPSGNASLELMWNSYSDNYRVPFVATPTWTKFSFNISEFGSNLPNLVKLPFKNPGSTGVSNFRIANYRMVPAAGTVVTPTGPSTYPHKASRKRLDFFQLPLPPCSFHRSSSIPSSMPLLTFHYILDLCEHCTSRFLRSPAKQALLFQPCLRPPRPPP